VEIFKAPVGHVFNDARNIQAGMPPANIVAMCEVACDFGFWA